MLPIPMQHVLSEVIYDDMSSSQKKWLSLIKIWPIWSIPTLSQNHHSVDPSEISCQIIVILFLAMLDNWFWCLTPGFWVLDIYMMLRSIWRSKTGWRGCKKPRTTSRSEVVTLVLSMLETWFWCQVPYSWSIGNHLGPFLWASAQSCRRPRTTSWSGDNYNEWKCNFGSESAGYLIFGSKPKFFLPWFGKIRKLGLSVDRCQTCSS